MRTVAIIWGTVAVLATWQSLVPESFFVSDISIAVDDIKVNEAPHALFKWRINYSFSNDWTARVIKLENNNVTQIRCWGSGHSAHIRSENVVRMVNFEWIVSPNKCIIDPGNYTVESIWTLRTFLWERNIVSRSNVFKVE